MTHPETDQAPTARERHAATTGTPTTDAVSPDAAPEPAQLSPEMLELAGRMFDAARTGDVDTLEAYIVAGLNPDLQNAKGDTFLTLAAYHDQPDTVKMLIDVGADVEKANDRGQRPLTCATFKGDVASMRHLLAAGADPDAGTPSARQTAQMFGGAEIAAVLDGAGD